MSTLTGCSSGLAPTEKQQKAERSQEYGASGQDGVVKQGVGRGKIDDQVTVISMTHLPRFTPLFMALSGRAQDRVLSLR